MASFLDVREGCNDTERPGYPVDRVSRPAPGQAYRTVRVAEVKPYSGQAGLAGQRDGEAGRGADGDQAADAGRDGLLHQLEPGPAADDQAGLGGGLAGEHAGAGHLVDGVVPADVLADHQSLALGGEEAGGVHAPGAAEDGLALAQAVGETSYDVGVRQRAGPARCGRRARSRGPR